MRIGLIVLLAFTGVNAIGGGIYGLAGARDVDPAWLDGSPFDDYFWPSLILLVAVGGSQLAAAAAVWARAARAPWFVAAAGAILVAWIVTQVALISLNSWLQPTFFAVGLAEIAAAEWLRRREPRSTPETSAPDSQAAS